MCVHVAAKVLHTSGFAFMMDSVPLMCKTALFLNSTRGLGLYCTNALNHTCKDIQSV